jgi:demethylmenaquinone methyltransferase/2-methoxy-6-polyprenyl-1,4-benzoquinol methylase
MSENYEASASTPAPPKAAATSAAEQKEARVYEVFQKISTDYDRMNDVISFRRHRAWKRALVRAAVAVNPRDILDVASGTGDIALALAQAAGQAQVVASDFSQNMLMVARERFEAAGRDALTIVCENAMALSFADGSFDVVTISFGLRNMPDYRQVISEMVRVLRPGGLFLCLDSSWPDSWLIRPFFRLYFTYFMPLLGRVVARAPEEYQWLNDSTENFLSKAELAVLMRECGLAEVSYRSFMCGSAALHRGVKPPLSCRR